MLNIKDARRTKAGRTRELLDLEEELRVLDAKIAAQCGDDCILYQRGGVRFRALDGRSIYSTGIGTRVFHAEVESEQSRGSPRRVAKGTHRYSRGVE